ncbi:hypothetical protein [Lysinibacillus piscis]|uniref:Lipoprotein n=1 Tax=Lysinibacillus piscis TaxID=2518931 RepID=A0ABQ5NIK0_9BACI|nr:hypothetical protein [Lysinibacillus sp. KH24]GLC88196.1 hypothetical protein LYSBPC_13230 [Lysinibacillus sp. KH24]
MYKWLKSCSLLILLIILSACTQSVEEQFQDGLQPIETTLTEKPAKSTNTIGNIQLYLPANFKVEDSSDEYNMIITKGGEDYILFINDREKEDSQLYYQLLKEDSTKTIVKEQTYENEDTFSFIAIVKTAKEDEFELIVSSGGIKMTTISPTKHVEDNLLEMAKIVHSVHLQ